MFGEWWIADVLVLKMIIQVIGGSCFILPYAIAQSKLAIFGVVLVMEAFFIYESMIMIRKMASRSNKNKLVVYLDILSDYVKFWKSTNFFLAIIATDLLFCAAFYMKTALEIIMQTWFNEADDTEKFAYSYFFFVVIALFLILVEALTEKIFKWELTVGLGHENDQIIGMLVQNSTNFSVNYTGNTLHAYKERNSLNETDERGVHVLKAEEATKKIADDVRTDQDNEGSKMKEKEVPVQKHNCFNETGEKEAEKATKKIAGDGRADQDDEESKMKENEAGEKETKKTTEKIAGDVGPDHDDEESKKETEVPVQKDKKRPEETMNDRNKDQDNKELKSNQNKVPVQMVWEKLNGFCWKRFFLLFLFLFLLAVIFDIWKKPDLCEVADRENTTYNYIWADGAFYSWTSFQAFIMKGSISVPIIILQFSVILPVSLEEPSYESNDYIKSVKCSFIIVSLGMVFIGEFGYEILGDSAPMVFTTAFGTCLFGIVNTMALCFTVVGMMLRIMLSCRLIQIFFEWSHDALYWVVAAVFFFITYHITYQFSDVMELTCVAGSVTGNLVLVILPRLAYINYLKKVENAEWSHKEIIMAFVCMGVNVVLGIMALLQTFFFEPN